MALPPTPRFIPACAGNRYPALTRCPLIAVHPRVCGEQKQAAYQWAKRNGSSPRVRGTEQQQTYQYANHRFIPACAGNSRDQWRDRRRGPVHPRVCGEQVTNLTLPHNANGSSPRVRGTVEIRRLRERVMRFIPACAGNRGVPCHRPPPKPVHPRVCGEQRGFDDAKYQRNGSSPRVRGTGGGLCLCRGRGRFIPACAGNRPGGPPPLRVPAVHPRVCGEQASGHLYHSL